MRCHFSLFVQSVERAILKLRHYSTLPNDEIIRGKNKTKHAIVEDLRIITCGNNTTSSLFLCSHFYIILAKLVETLASRLTFLDMRNTMTMPHLDTKQMRNTVAAKTVTVQHNEFDHAA